MRFPTPHPLPWTRQYLTRSFTYTDRGRDFVRGYLDCWGFTMLVLREQFGVEVPDLLDLYSTVWEREQLERACVEGRKLFSPVRCEDAQPGDIALIRLFEAPTHAAVVCGPSTIVDLPRRGVGVHSIAPASPYGRRLEGVYRWIA